MSIDVAFNELASRVAALMIDLDLMRSEPYFSDADIEHATATVSQEVDGLLYADGWSREGFLLRMERGNAKLAAGFLRSAFSTLNPERNWIP